MSGDCTVALLAPIDSKRQGDQLGCKSDLWEALLWSLATPPIVAAH
jgi:hypothetical protein